MHVNVRRGARLAVSSAVAVAATCAVGIAAAPPAHAAPCGNSGSGSSGSLDGGSLGSGSLGSGSLGGSLGSGSLGSGSLGGSSGSGDSANEPGVGPQGALPTWRNATSRVVSWVTGPKSPNNTLQRLSISGTDLGVAWDNGSGQTLMAFGDTFGWCNVQGQQWRHNVLMRTADTNLADGLTVPDAVPGDQHSGAVVQAGSPTFAREMIGSFGVAGVEVTTIPTAGISIGGKQYVNYMSVRKWGPAGVWDTNFSGIAVSGDNGQTWQPQLSTLRLNTGITLRTPDPLPDLRAIDTKFQQAAYVAGHGADADWIYQFGTPNGRYGGCFLTRFKPGDILDLDRYEYWTGSGWTTDINASLSAVVPAPVGEISVAYSETLRKYVMLDGANGIRMLVADKPQGPWKLGKTLVPLGALVVYGPMMLPNSPALTGTGDKLYFNASRWSDYNVLLVESKIN